MHWPTWPAATWAAHILAGRESLTVTTPTGTGAWRPALVLTIVIAVLSALWVPTQPAAAAIQVPDVSARGVYAFDLDTGIQLFAKNEHERMPIGSVVKVVTALVTVEHTELSDKVMIVADDLVDDPLYSNMQLQAGDTLTVSQLLYGLMIPSGSDAATALARYVGGILSRSDDPIAQLDAFVAEMNAFVDRHGLENSRFTNPHGLDAPNNYSSAHDISILSGMLMKNEFLAKVVREPGYSFISAGPEARQYQASTTNQLLGEAGVIGIKTGSTDDAGGCVVLARQVNNANSTVITAVLGAELAYDASGMITTDERWADASQLLQFMDTSFAWLPLADAETFVNLPTELAVWDVQIAGNPTIPVAVREDTQTRYQLALNPDGGGTIDIYYDQVRVGSLPLEAASATSGNVAIAA
ncbi:MAG TPA: serine hydrolase [Thermomicrobiales bacterium]|nr:serine hydrolase [Thermomicrobiales bacterium]